MFCVSNISWKVKCSLNKLKKVGIALSVSFSLINGMESNKGNGMSNDYNSKKMYNSPNSGVKETLNSDKGNVDVVMTYKYLVGDKLKLFGDEFFGDNNGNCKMFVNGKKCSFVKEVRLFGGGKGGDMSEVKVSLKWNNNPKKLSNMFDRCVGLYRLDYFKPDIVDNVTDMCNMFFGCLLLSSLPDISKWNTRNVINMSCMFGGCSSLSSLPDISKWHTNNLTYMIYMFCACTSLSSLPDISKWYTSKVPTNYMASLSRCNNLIISKDIKSKLNL